MAIGSLRIFTLIKSGLPAPPFKLKSCKMASAKKIFQMVKLSAAGKFDQALALAETYLSGLRQERDNAEDAIHIVKQILSGETQKNRASMKRKEASEYLGVSMDALRNWEMNGLLTVKRKENGYRIYTDDDIKRLKIIRSLRCANYSLEAILRMLQQLSKIPMWILRLRSTRRDHPTILSLLVTS